MLRRPRAEHYVLLFHHAKRELCGECAAADHAIEVDFRRIRHAVSRRYGRIGDFGSDAIRRYCADHAHGSTALRADPECRHRVFVVRQHSIRDSNACPWESTLQELRHHLPLRGEAIRQRLQEFLPNAREIVHIAATEGYAFLAH